MTTTSKSDRPSTEERFKRSLPFEWGYGSTPRTSKLREVLNWKGAVTEHELANAAMGLPKTRFREGVKIDMCRARIVTAAFRETEGEPIQLQYARMVEKLCDEIPVFIKDGELIVGDPNGGADKIRWYPEINVDWVPEAVTTGGFYDIVTDDERQEIIEDICPFWERRSIQAIIKASLPEEMAPVINAYGVYMSNLWEQGLIIPAYDWAVLFRDGLNARIEKAESKLKDMDTKVDEMDPAEYLEKRYNWQAMIRCGKATIRYSQRLSDTARRQASQETDERRKRELEAMANSLEHVPANSPRTFHECLQFYWIIEVVADYLARWGYGCGTRIDQVWWPYYEADITSGRITREEAVELVECLFLKIQEIGAPLEWPLKFAGVSGANTMYTANICGPTDDGQDASNELSFIVMEALGNLHLSQPPIAIQYHENISPEVVSAAIDLCRTGLGHPSFFNRDLMEEWARLRGWTGENVKKVQVSACAANHIMGQAVQGSGLAPGTSMNCIELFNEVLRLNDQKTQCGPVIFETGKKAAEMDSADELMEAYLKRMKYYAEIGNVSWNIAQQILMDRKPDPCNSLIMDETLERGIDLVKFHKEGDTWPEATPFGGINVANSLAAIQHLVFNEKKYSIEELIQALDANWSGYEVMRQDFINAPKYGNEDDFADDWAVRFLTGMNDTMNTIKDAWGFTWTMDGSTAAGYVLMGLAAGASPDGRFACAAVADGSLSPIGGTDLMGPTTVLNSASKIPYQHSELFNQRFMPQFLESDNKKLFADYLKVWYKRGIPHIQFNVIDGEKLRDAQVKPDEHADLIVRVAGYSAHFIDLPDYTQDSIIERTEQSFS